MAQVVVEVSAQTDDAYEHEGYQGYDDSGTSLFTGLVGGSSEHMGMRFLSVDLPSSCTVDDCSLQLIDIAYDGGTTVVDIAFEDAASPATFSSGSTPQDRTPTTAGASASSIAEPGGAPPQPQTIDESSYTGMVASLQELVDTYGAITNVVLLMPDNGSSDYNTWASYDHTTSQAPELTIDYTEGGVSLAGAQPAASGTISAEQTLGRSVAGSQPAPSGSLSARQTLAITLSGNQPAASGSIAAAFQLVQVDVAGDQPAATGAISAMQTLLRSVSGGQPAPTGTISAKQTLHVTLAGNQPAGSGAIAASSANAVSVAGDQPAPSGSIANTRPLTHITLSGNQPNPTGALSVSTDGASTVSGSQPAPSGSLTVRRLFTQITLVGVQPSPSGALSALQTLAIALAGEQPASSGGLSPKQTLAITIEGSQPAASGEITGSPVADSIATVTFEVRARTLAFSAKTRPSSFEVQA